MPGTTMFAGHAPGPVALCIGWLLQTFEAWAGARGYVARIVRL